MAAEPDRITELRCIDLAGTDAGRQNLYLRDTNADGEPWKRIRSAKATATPTEGQLLHACTVELVDGSTLFFNDTDRLEVGIFNAR